ncbi:MAG: hypothetical protein HYS26_00305 [Candidatus Kaiserbacteria bacterium]|nr:MAG: hypothetical protein HYS26_00305 [Candidatus Kaiserbacteria bacterium]
MKIPGMHTWESVRYAWDFRHEPESLRALAGFFWRTLLAAAAAISLAIGLWSASMLISIVTGADSIGLSPQGSGVAPLNRMQLRSVLDTFDLRATNYQSLQSSPQITDPSK